MLKIQYMSDLHAEFGFSRRVAPAGDVLVLAGDLATRPGDLADLLRRLPAIPTLIVAGNHEFYGHSVGAATLASYRRAATAFSHCRYLENQAVVIGGVRFLAATLWTDFAGGAQAAACQRMLNDFYRITAADGSRRIRPEDFAALHRRTAAWLAEELARDHPRTVVVTHHAPSFRSVPPRFAGSSVSGAFCVDLEAMITMYQPAVWIHGHVHDSADYVLGRSRILCNPYGYEGQEENALFDPAAVVEV